MNQLEEWNRNEVIELVMSKVAYDEALSGNDARRQEKTMSHFYSHTSSSAWATPERTRLIERSIFPDGARTQSEKNDVSIVVSAAEFGAILVTNDGASRAQPRGILGSRAKLAELRIQVLTPDEAVATVREAVAFRDQVIRERCERHSLKLPDWVGKD